MVEASVQAGQSYVLYHGISMTDEGNMQHLTDKEKEQIEIVNKLTMLCFKMWMVIGIIGFIIIRFYRE